MGNPVGLFYCFFLSGVQAFRTMRGVWFFSLAGLFSKVGGGFGDTSFLGLTVSPPSRQAYFHAMVAQLAGAADL